MKKLYQKYKKGFWHFVKFQCVGVLNFLVDFGVLKLLTAVLGWPLVISNTISYTCGVINSFFFNRFWTFKMKLKFFSVYSLTVPSRVGEKRVRHFRFLSLDFIKFIFVNLVSLGVNDLAMYVLVNLYGLSGPTAEGTFANLWAKLIATAFSFIVNFAGNKLLVFRESSPATEHIE